MVLLSGVVSEHSSLRSTVMRKEPLGALNKFRQARSLNLPCRFHVVDQPDLVLEINENCPLNLTQLTMLGKYRGSDSQSWLLEKAP
jgi:hypothetical protein